MRLVQRFNDLQVLHVSHWGLKTKPHHSSIDQKDHPVRRPTVTISLLSPGAELLRAFHLVQKQNIKNCIRMHQCHAAYLEQAGPLIKLYQYHKDQYALHQHSPSKSFAYVGASLFFILLMTPSSAMLDGGVPPLSTERGRLELIQQVKRQHLMAGVY